MVSPRHSPSDASIPHEEHMAMASPTVSACRSISPKASKENGKEREEPGMGKGREREEPGKGKEKVDLEKGHSRKENKKTLKKKK